MGEGIPQQRQGPKDLPDDFDEKLEGLREQKEDMPSRFAGTEGNLEDMAEGRDGDGAREYYPGWTDEHFKKLLEALNKE